MKELRQALQDALNNTHPMRGLQINGLRGDVICGAFNFTFQERQGEHTYSFYMDINHSQVTCRRTDVVDNDGTNRDNNSANHWFPVTYDRASKSDFNMIVGEPI